MFNRKKKNKKKYWAILPTAGVCVSALIFGIVHFFGGNSIAGHWELVDIRPTSERIEQLPAAQRSILERYFDERVEYEFMELQFFDDYSGLMVLNIQGSIENHPFTWTVEDGLLTKRLGVFSAVMEYEVTRSRLILIDHTEDGGVVREFRMVR